MRTLYLIRHTTPDIASGICYGQADLDVSDSFNEELLSIKSHIQGIKPIMVFSSPLKRCSILAESLFPDNKISYSDLLKEINFGKWEEKKWSKIHSKEKEKWFNDFVNEAPPGGESLSQLNDRANTFITQCKETLKYNSVNAIVTHSGIIRCIISQCLSIPLNKIFQLKFNYASVVKINIYDSYEEVEILKS